MSGKKKTIIIVALLLVVFIGSISYALWSVTLEQTDSNIVKTGCFTVDMVEQTDEINLPEEYPVTDAEGRKYSPFTFTIQNTCTIDSSYSVNLKVEDGTTLEHQYVKAVLDGDKAQVLTDYEKATNEDKYQLTTGTLAGASSEGAGDGESVTYNLRLWLDQDTPTSQMSKDFYAKIVIENITTSGAIKKEVLATADISETESDNVTYTYYNTGELTFNGTGRMSDADSSFVAELSKTLINKESFYSTLTDEEKAVLSSVYADLVYGSISGNFKIGVDLVKENFGLTDSTACTTYPTNFEEYKSCLQDLGITEDSFYTLLDKFTTEYPIINSVSIDEGITNISRLALSLVKLEELILPSTIKELGEFAFYLSDIGNLVLNDGLETIRSRVFMGSYISNINIPNTVIRIEDAIIIQAKVPVTVKLPKSDNYTTLGVETFMSANNATIIVPSNITVNEYNNSFTDAKNLTLNLECSEEETPSWVVDLVNDGTVVKVNYNYKIES